MRIRQSQLHLIAAIAAVLSAACVAMAQTETRAQIEDRLEKRYAKLVEAERTAKVGENAKGLVEVPHGGEPADSDIAKLIAEENADRTALYAMIAAEESMGKAKVSADDVAARNARRKFAKAQPEHFLKTKDGIWVQRGDVATFKKAGSIGETWNGRLDTVDDKSKADAQIVATINLENSLRLEDYQRLADKRRTTVDEVAVQAGKTNIEKAAEGEYVKPKDQPWERKK